MRCYGMVWSVMEGGEWTGCCEGVKVESVNNDVKMLDRIDKLIHNRWISKINIT